MLPVHLLDVWAAFWWLDGDRQIGFEAVGYIPTPAMDAYFRLFGPREPLDRRWMAELIRRTDVVYVEIVNARKPGDKH